MLAGGEAAPGVPMLMPDPFAFGPGLATMPAAKQATASARAKADAAILRSPGVRQQAVPSPDPPWGKRSKDLPLTRHAASPSLPRVQAARSGVA